MSSPSPPFFHPGGRLFRSLVLLVASVLTFGSYFAYDSIGALETTLVRTWSTTEEGVGVLYTIYSVAGIVSVLAGGMLTDRIGTRRASLLFSALIVVGAAIVAAAPSVTVACVGRFIFGAGSESVTVAQNAILTRWFRGRELALSFGVTTTVSRLGTLFVFNTMAVCDRRYGVSTALWCAAGFCLLSLMGNVLYCAMDLWAEKVQGMQEEGSGGDVIVVSDIRQFGRSYWYVILLCVTFYSAIFPFTALSSAFFHEKWGLPTTVDTGHSGFLWAVFQDFLHMFETANGTSSIIIFASMCFAPFAGRLVDRHGRRASLMVVGALVMIPSYLLMGFTMIPPAYPMALLGLAFVLVPAAMWPAVPLVVDRNRVGTAFGLMTMVQNVGMALFPWLNGRLRVMTHDYRASMAMFACLGVVGLILALLLRAQDAATGRVLEAPGENAPDDPAATL